MTTMNAAAETISNTIYEEKPYGTPEEFNLQTIPEKIIDVEYTEVDDNLERKSANDNGINNNPTPPVTTNALIPVGNSCQSVALPVAPENLITCIEFNQSIAEATMKMVKNMVLQNQIWNICIKKLGNMPLLFLKHNPG